MQDISQLLKNNREWSERMKQQDPDFFARLERGQAPRYLWIGCSDSRVPANEILGLLPGEVFVHRNIANLVVHTDINALSVIEYAVEVLKVEHIIVCGHYGCGGIKASMFPRSLGLLDHWLQHISDIHVKYKQLFEVAPDDANKKCDLLCEVNVREQMQHVCRTSVVQRAWKEGRSLSIHGWIYALSNGLINELWPAITAVDQMPALYRMDFD